jgi:Fic-DOC domain mobile mystery protein B
VEGPVTDPFDERGNGPTSLGVEERDGLIPSYITTRSELNEAEQANILEAQTWAFGRQRSVLDTRSLDNLHRRMFGNVWRWAGRHRRSAKNVGVEAYRIPQELRQLVDDCRYWVEHKTYEPDEIAARFHHRLVWIHAYPNGNGRHARLATDLLLGSLGCQRFSWGSQNLVDPGETRQRYIAALREADQHNMTPLLEFVRS